MSVRFKASTYIPTTLKVVVTGTQRALTGFLIVSMSAIWTNVPAMAATPVPSTGVSLNYPAPILNFARQSHARSHLSDRYLATCSSR
jgi:hypothetical protein